MNQMEPGVLPNRKSAPAHRGDVRDAWRRQANSQPLLGIRGSGGGAVLLHAVFLHDGLGDIVRLGGFDDIAGQFLQGGLGLVRLSAHLIPAGAERLHHFTLGNHVRGLPAHENEKANGQQQDGKKRLFQRGIVVHGRGA